MARVILEIKGTTPLMMHNERLSDPDDEFAKEIKTITNKGTNQTESDKQLISKLEFYGGLYTNSDGDVIIPSANIIKCLKEGGTVTKSGKKISQGLAPHSLATPLMVINGSRNKDQLWAKPEHVDRRQVKVGRGRIKRTRPIFPLWGLRAEFELLEDVLSLTQFGAIVELSGRAIGLGDARILGYGRFEAKVVKTTQAQRAPRGQDAMAAEGAPA